MTLRRGLRRRAIPRARRSAPSCPLRIRSGTGFPGVQMPIIASAPAVTVRLSLRIATAFTALSCRRKTCSARLSRSDQRIADASKLPESAVVPSAETANARIGPPCPRSCASAGPRAAAAPSSVTHQIKHLSERRMYAVPASSVAAVRGYTPPPAAYQRQIRLVASSIGRRLKSQATRSYFAR